MRKSFKMLTRSMVEELNQYESLHDKKEDLIIVEMMATGLRLSNQSIAIEDAWIILTGYSEPVLSKGYDQKLIDRLRILFSFIHGESGWNQLLVRYFDIPEAYRLLVKKKDKIRFSAPTYYRDRENDYGRLLTSAIPYHASDKQVLKKQEFYYKKWEHDEEVIYRGSIPKSWLKQTPLLPAYKDKKDISFSTSFHWLDVAQKMDCLLDEADANWEDRFKPIALQSLEDASSFTYRGINHIAGGLASGKSTFRTINTFWLVKEKQAKVGMIENSVSEVLEQVKQLKRLGIHAVPLIGKSNRQEHFTNHLQSNQFTHMSEVSNNDALRSLSNTCLAKSLAGDMDVKDNRYPCETIYEKEKKTPQLCPLAHQCGIYQDWTDLHEADVWVTTSQAVLKTRLPAMVDPYKRLMYEAMYDLLDVIFIDEADQVQRQFDENFMLEEGLFGKSDYVFEQLEREFTKLPFELVQKNTSSAYLEWINIHHHLKETILNVTKLVRESEKLRNILRHNVIYLNGLNYWIVEILSDDSDVREKIGDDLRLFGRNAHAQSLYEHDHLLERLMMPTSFKRDSEIIQTWLSELSVKMKDDIDMEKLYVMLKFYVHLSHIENSLHYLKYNMPYIQQYTRINLPILSANQDFRPFMKEAMTGIMFGYRYVEGEDVTDVSFKVIQYTSVGRELLQYWNKLYEAADNKEGPGVVLLSGTSYAPDSVHYHLEAEPNWIITSTRQLSSIKQAIIETRNPENEEVIYISGVRNKEYRNQLLARMIHELEPKIVRELAESKKKKEHRRVLLIVNSYEDVLVVGSALAKSTRLKDNYRLLTREQQGERKAFSRIKIEQFKYEDEEILVAPLLSLSRGFNIVDDDGKALFGSVFFLVRPYPIPNDLSYFVQTMHGYLPLYLQELKKANESGVDAIRSIRKKSRMKFEFMYKRPEFWKVLSEEERTVLAWFTFIPIWQVIGRLLRGGVDANVYYVDGKFYQRTNHTPSLIDYWKQIMRDNGSCLFSNLYGPFIKSIHKLEGKK